MKKLTCLPKIKKQTIITALSFLRSMSNAFQANPAVLFNSSNSHSGTKRCVSKSLRERCSGWYLLMVRGDKKSPAFLFNTS